MLSDDGLSREGRGATLRADDAAEVEGKEADARIARVKVEVRQVVLVPATHLRGRVATRARRLFAIFCGNLLSRLWKFPPTKRTQRSPEVRRGGGLIHASSTMPSVLVIGCAREARGVGGRLGDPSAMGMRRRSWRA